MKNMWTEVDERFLMPIELDEDGCPDIGECEQIYVSYGGVQKKCFSVGWVRRQDGTFQIKTNEWFMNFTDRVPMECVQIIITRRELRLREELAKVRSTD